jgi:hypothetical protein
MVVSSGEDAPPPTKASPVKKKKPAAKRPAPKSDSSDLSDSDGDSDFASRKKKTAAAKKAKPAKKESEYSSTVCLFKRFGRRNCNDGGLIPKSQREGAQDSDLENNCRVRTLAFSSHIPPYYCLLKIFDGVFQRVFIFCSPLVSFLIMKKGLLF